MDCIKFIHPSIQGPLLICQSKQNYPLQGAGGGDGGVKRSFVAFSPSVFIYNHCVSGFGSINVIVILRTITEYEIITRRLNERIH